MVTKNDIGLAGEMRVASELLLKGYRASITFGNAKATDIVILGDNNSFVRVEVKTSRNRKKFVTGYYPKYTDPTATHPDVWVFYLPRIDGQADGDKFFVLTHEKVGELQLEVDKGRKTKRGEGCDNIPLAFLEREKETCETCENRWSLIDDELRRNQPVTVKKPRH